jgi:hypothetical protein
LTSGSAGWLVQALEDTGALTGYHLLPATRPDGHQRSAAARGGEVSAADQRERQHASCECDDGCDEFDRATRAWSVAQRDAQLDAAVSSCRALYGLPQW